MTTTTTATCERCGTGFTYQRYARPRVYCSVECRSGRRVDLVAAGRADLTCLNCGRVIDRGATGGRPKSVYCSDACKEAVRGDRQKRERMAAHGERTCKSCGKPLPLSAKGDAETCSRTCSVAYQNRVRSERARLARMARPRPPCGICGASIDPARRRNVLYCSEACKRIATAIRYRERHPDWQQTYRYGLAAGTYGAMLVAQGGRCAICGRTESGGKGGRFHIDHDHVTNEIRGLLCHDCNIALGHLHDDPEALRRAIEYLSHPPARRSLGPHLRAARVATPEAEPLGLFAQDAEPLDAP